MEPWVSVLLIIATVLILRERGHAWPSTIAAVGALVALAVAAAVLIMLLLTSLS